MTDIGTITPRVAESTITPKYATEMMGEEMRLHDALRKLLTWPQQDSEAGEMLE